ncbi:MAG: arsenite methyltransferase [Chloroflexota bacterium]|nr:arsenite methyltransferase [Chloroflexota bacterium]
MTVLPTTSSEQIKLQVRDRYGRLAEDVLERPEPVGCGCAPAESLSDGDVIFLQDGASSCCGPEQQVLDADHASRLYEQGELATLPDSVTAASLGCGNPMAIAALKPGQVVMDLGSGGGIDCFLAGRQVGPEGRVIGLDMTPQMIELAEQNRAKLGAAAANVSFQLGEMEAMPLPDSSVDVMISNCVINLSPDKDAVFREAFRVLRPGGYLAVSDIVTLQPLPEQLATSLSAWSECVAGALDVGDYTRKLEEAGFERVAVAELSSKDFQGGEAPALVTGDLDRWVASARILAYRPLDNGQLSIGE